MKKTNTKTTPRDTIVKMSKSLKDKDKYVLRLYVTGSTSRSIMAITNLKKIC